MLLVLHSWWTSVNINNDGINSILTSYVCCEHCLCCLYFADHARPRHSAILPAIPASAEVL